MPRAILKSGTPDPVVHFSSLIPAGDKVLLFLPKLVFRHSS